LVKVLPTKKSSTLIRKLKETKWSILCKKLKHHYDSYQGVHFYTSLTLYKIVNPFLLLIFYHNVHALLMEVKIKILFLIYSHPNLYFYETKYEKHLKT